MLNISIGSKKLLPLPQNKTAEQAPEVMQEAHQLDGNPQSSSNQSPHTESSAEAHPAGSIEPDHFDELLGGSDFVDGGAGGGDALPPGMLGKDEFYQIFVTGFKVASIATHLKSVEVNPQDQGARAASDAIYETVSEIPALRFLLQPQGKVFGRIVTIGMFVVPMAMNVQAEIAARAVAKKPNAAPQTGKAVVVPDFDMSGAKP